MKKSIIVLLLISAMLSVFVACKSNESEQQKTYTVTFIQAGRENIIKTVTEGEALTDIPMPEERIGYTVVWEKSDFSNITENMMVYAVETANEYNITYDPGSGTLADRTQKVTYDANYTLALPERTDNYAFSHWKRKDGTGVAQVGTWKIAEDVTLTAVYTEPCTITFVQTGQPAILKEIKAGEALTDIPTPVAKTGYSIVWDRNDFSDITENITVNAIETPNQYNIYYDLGALSEEGSVMIASQKQSVTFDAPYNLYIPQCDGYTFLKWVVVENNEQFSNGIYTIDGDTNLVALWETDSGSEQEWTDFY